jgi:cytoskeletal protein RodZ
VPRAVAFDATPPVPSAVAPAMPPPLPMASPAQKERAAVAPKSFNPWPLLAIAAVVIFAAMIGVIFILLRQPKPSKQQTSTTPSQSAQTPGTVPSPSPPTTMMTQNPASRQARSPKTTPAGDTQDSSESENASAFERAKETEIPQAIGPALHAGDSYAAIAFSPSTGRWGYGNGFPTKSEAITRARRECGQRDAKTNWCKDAWIALAISNQSAGGWGSSWGDTPEIARSKAISECLSRNPDAHVVLCVSAYR